MAWDEHYSGFEIHATENKDPQWVWHVYTDLPQTVKQFGGTLRLRITQPERAVFDEQGQVHEGGDGVEMRFIVDRNGNRETVQQVALNLHADPEQRDWQPVKVPIPTGSQRLHIEALSGPPGSNNWNDWVWISVERVRVPFERIIRFIDWFSIGLLVYLSGLALLMLSRTSFGGRFLGVIKYVEYTASANTF
jgi:hypothetical protein